MPERIDDPADAPPILIPDCPNDGGSRRQPRWRTPHPGRPQSSPSGRLPLHQVHRRVTRPWHRKRICRTRLEGLHGSQRAHRGNWAKYNFKQVCRTIKGVQDEAISLLGFNCRRLSTFDVPRRCAVARLTDSRYSKNTGRKTEPFRAGSTNRRWQA